MKRITFFFALTLLFTFSTTTFAQVSDSKVVNNNDTETTTFKKDKGTKDFKYNRKGKPHKVANRGVQKRNFKDKLGKSKKDVKRTKGKLTKDTKRTKGKMKQDMKTAKGKAKKGLKDSKRETKKWLGKQKEKFKNSNVRKGNVGRKKEARGK